MASSFDNAALFRAVRATVVMAMLVLPGCGSGALPKSKSVTSSPWTSFDAAKAAYDRVMPGSTTTEMLQEAGFDPYSTPNVRVLSYLDIMHQFLTTDAIRTGDLHPSVQSCIAARDACLGYYVALEHIDHERKGSAMLDLFNFHRETHETGWKFNALFILREGKVTYKLWSGTPRIDRRIDQENPLGPVQEPATILRNHIP